jgi:hypothetical protein
MTTHRARPRVLIPCPELHWKTNLVLPRSEDNMFGRVIRDPHSVSSNPKERECTEMLCALLRNTSVVRRAVLRYFSFLLGQNQLNLDEMTFEFLTEQNIGSKRDDLRVLGWKQSAEENVLTVLWTIEVKVGAAFHQSSSIVVDGSIYGDEPATVNQIVNYDYWLAGEAAEYRGGIVLAINDYSKTLPDDLDCQWGCTTWTKLGELFGEVLSGQNIPDRDQFLAEHVLGFIRQYLWRESEMKTTKVDFDDIALLRAFSDFGLDIEKKIDELVSGLFEVAQEYGYGRDVFTHQKSLYKPMGRSILYTSLAGLSASDYPQLLMGVSKAGVSLWLETAPTNNLKPEISQLVEEVIPALKERNSDWSRPDLDWTDLSITMPLQALLAVDDQQTVFREFFRKALQDLGSVHLADKIALLKTP